MNVIISRKELSISYIIAFTFILAMVEISVLLNDQEVILPEVAAMAIAMWVYREAGWIRQPLRIFLAPSITATIGYAVNQLPIAYVGKVILTIVLIMLLLRLLQTNLAPSIATGLLPVVINATEWTFIIAVFIFTFILMLGVLLFGLNKGLEKKVPIQYKYMLVFISLNMVWIASVTIAGYAQLAVIPPILVVVYEVLQKPMYSSKMAFKQVLLLNISATVGTLLYLNINSWILITILAMLLMLILLQIVGIRLPAVYAFPLLTFVLPADIVTSLPVGTLVATVFFFGSVLAIKKWEMTRNKKRMQ
ncbi:hypothetical protein ACIQYL_18350 [Lysinibacillus xylanilyticus]|uniref:hypothetical protein n=1 Tax=Lysinibacillus xylanilyticus TaxID=582475 RepID=UPI003823C903